MSIANNLARKELLTMVPYQSARRLHSSNGDMCNKIWLNANEAPGTGEYQLTGHCINRYPDFQPENLLESYSQYSGIDTNKILATRGADEGIELLIRTFCHAYQDNIIICPPTYGMYRISAQNHGAGVISVPLTSEQSLDLPALGQQVEKAKIIFLCSPGNPTGNLLPREEIAAVLTLFANKAIVVVDEAYIEFSPENSVVNWITQYPNLVILRTLSKAFALAGLRCGFTLANEDIITMLSKVIAPYPIAAPVADIASHYLSKQGVARMSKQVQQTCELREKLSSWLESQPWCKKVFTSDANFVLFQCKDEQTKNFIFDKLVENEILIRDQSTQQNLANCLRISIGSEEELKYLQQIVARSFNNLINSAAQN